MQISPDANVIRLQGQNRLSLYQPPNTTHFSLCVLSGPPDSPPILKRTHTNTSRRQSCAEREKCNGKRETTSSSYFTLNKRPEYSGLLTQMHTNTLWEKKKDKPLTCLSWRRLANTDSLKLLFTFLHTAGNGWWERPSANVATPVYKRGKKKR